MFIRLRLLALGDLSARLAVAGFAFFIRQGVAEACQGCQIDLCHQVILLAGQRLTLLGNGLGEAAHAGIGLIGFGVELLQGLAGGLLAVTDHLGQVGQAGRLFAGGCLELVYLLCQRLISLRLGALGLQNRRIEHLIILLQGGLQLGDTLAERLVSIAQGLVALL